MKNLLLPLFIIIPSIVVAQPKAPDRSAVQGGEITMEQDSKTEDSYEVQQSKGIEFLKRVAAAASSGGSGTIPMPEESTLSYLNVAYLYCSITEGTCPAIIDAVLEADVINARSGSPSCPISTSFWKLYVRSDMEQRHNHYVKTGFLGVTDDFKKRRRPAYIKCKDTVAQILSDPNRASRYQAGGQVLSSLNRAVRIAEELKAKVPNLFTSLGAR